MRSDGCLCKYYRFEDITDMFVNDDCPIHGFCKHCDGSGILNVEVMNEQYSPYDGIRVTTWEPKASSCHGCAAGKEWEGLLE